jgi:hypothetical protein
MTNSLDIEEKKLKVLKDVISYIKKNLNKNVSYEDIYEIMLKKMDEYKLKNENIWMNSFMNSWLIIKKDRVMYKKENKYLKEKKLVDDYFKIKKNITSLDLDTITNTVNFQQNLSSFLIYLSFKNIDIKLFKYLLDYHYIEKKKLNKFYLEKKVLKYLDIIIKQNEEILKKRKLLL